MKIVLVSILLFILFPPHKKKEELKLLVPHKKFIEYVTEGKKSFYSIKKSGHQKKKSKLPIGIFDSGIGGLTVFDAIANADFYNLSHAFQPDGLKDFEQERFIYFGDQANMPYSNYVEEGKKELLVEHILKNALFLLNHKYHISANSPKTAKNKPGVKAIVIACNTGTAYGKSQIEELCKISGSSVKIIGVIDAGCKGALEIIEKGGNVTIAVLATPATVGSMAYVNTLNELKKNRSEKISVIQQGGKGLHESIESKPEFIHTSYTRPYHAYQGPSLYHEQYRLQKDLIPYYHFDTTRYRMLYNNKCLPSSDTIQINSVENYARYHVVSLVEQLKKKEDTIPLRAIILGCTHYPFASSTIKTVLGELKATARYGHLLADTVLLIDPALNTATELFSYLSEQNLFSKPGQGGINESCFFLSVPNPFEPEVERNADGSRFTYEYQYRKRSANELKDYTLIVPFFREHISEEQLGIIKERLPFTYDLIENKMNEK